MNEQFNAELAKQEVIKAASESIEAQAVRSKPKRRKRTTAAKEMKKLFVSTSEIKKQALTKKNKTRQDEYIVNPKGDMVMSDRSMNYRIAQMKISNSLQEHKIMTGKVTAVEKHGRYWSAVIFVGDIKVIIPVFEFLNLDVNKQSQGFDEESRLLMMRRLGSMVDFIVKFFNEELGLAFASRLEAMKIKSEFFYVRDFGNGPYISEGDTVKARVVATAKGGVSIEVMGVECFIPSREVSHNFVIDASKYAEVGGEVDARILKIVKLEDDSIEIEASIRAVKESMFARVYNQVEPNKKYVGTITAINNYGVFVNIYLGDYTVDVLCAYPTFGNMPVVGANATVNITEKNEKGIFGTLNHIAIV